jgi:hypothetical protein
MSIKGHHACRRIAVSLQNIAAGAFFVVVIIRIIVVWIAE